MALVHLADLTDTSDRILITQMAAQCVARVCRNGYHATVAYRVGRLPDQTWLRIVRVDGKVARHVQKASQTGVRPSGKGASRPRSTKLSPGP